MSKVAPIEDLPSMLWVAVPSALLVSAYFVRKWYLSYQLRVHGIGRGAQGFQTNIRKVRVTPDIAARIQRGEDVSPAEIEAASKKMDELEANEAREGNGKNQASPAPKKKFIPPVYEDEKPFVDSRTPREPSPKRSATTSIDTNTRTTRSKSKAVEDQDSGKNEWLPENVTGSAKKRRGRKG